MQKLTNTKSNIRRYCIHLFIVLFSISSLQHLQAENEGTLPQIDETTLLDTLVYMAVNNDATTLSADIVESTGATYHEPYLDYYKLAVAEADTFVSVLRARTLFNQINTDQSLKEIQAMAGNNDASNLQLWQLEDLAITGLNSAFLENYKSAIADVSSIENAEALQVLIDGVNEQESLSLIADMAANNDASLLSILLLQNAGASPVVSLFIEDYKTAVEAEETFNNISEIQDLVAGINTTLAFPRIQQMAEEDDASLLDYALIIAAGADNIQELYVPYYKEPIENRTLIPDLGVLQHIVDSINPVAAWDIIQTMNNSGNVEKLNTDILIDAGASGVNTFFPQVLDIYKTGIYSADTIPDLVTLQLVVDISNQWFEFIIWIIFQDVHDLEIADLELVGAVDIVDHYLPFYKIYLLKVDYNTFPYSLQPSVVVMGNLLGRISDMASTSDASELTIEMLDSLETPGVMNEHLSYYMDYIASASSIDTLPDLYDLIDQANVFSQIVDMAEAGDASSLTIRMLEDAGVQNLVSENLPSYLQAIQDQSTIASFSALQSIIDEVNAIIQGVSLPDSLAELKIYPVPAKEHLNVELENRIFNVCLLDMKGSVLYQRSNCSGKAIISLGDLPGGMVVLKVSSSSGSTSFPVIID